MRTRAKWIGTVALAITTTCSIGGCGGSQTPTEVAEGTEAPGVKATNAQRDEPRAVAFEQGEGPGLEMVLRDAREGVEDAEAAPKTVRGRSLPASRTAKLLDRAGPFEDDAKRQDFRKRKASKPAPRTGETVSVPFPPPEQPPAPEGGQPGELRVVRFAPEGSVPLAPHLAITFSRPMISVTSQQRASDTVPVALEPEPPGSWRWLGTRTLLFKPEERFLMATVYDVTVPAGTRSADGSVLSKARAFAFDTPAPKLVQHAPHEGLPTSLKPALSLRFDQRIAPTEVLEHVTLKGGRKIRAAGSGALGRPAGQERGLCVLAGRSPDLASSECARGERALAGA